MFFLLMVLNISVTLQFHIKKMISSPRKIDDL
jgi:hypothetical protein